MEKTQETSSQQAGDQTALSRPEPGAANDRPNSDDEPVFRTETNADNDEAISVTEFNASDDAEANAQRLQVILMGHLFSQMASQDQESEDIPLLM